MKRIPLMNVSLSKIGHDFSKMVVQNLTLKKMFLTKKRSPKLIFTNEKKSLKNSVDF